MKRFKNLQKKVLFLLVILIVVLFCFAPGVILTACPDATVFWKIVMTVWAVPAVGLCLWYYRLLAKTPAKEYPLDPIAPNLSFLDEDEKCVSGCGTFETKAAVMILLTIAIGTVVGFDIFGVFHSWKVENSELHTITLTLALLLIAGFFPTLKNTKKNR